MSAVEDKKRSLLRDQKNGGSGSGEKRELEGPARVAVILLALGEEFGSPIWQLLDDDEIRTISLAMAQLGPIEPEHVEELVLDFVNRMGTSAVTGDFDRTEKLLQRLLPKTRAELIMEEIRGPAGRNMWQKLSNVHDQTLASYLKNEYPQTVAVILSKISSDHAARVLAILPEEFALDVIGRMLRMEAVPKEALERIEETLRVEFIANLSHSSRRDSHELMAEIFNSFDRQTEGRFLSALDDNNRDAAQRIRSLMFVFEDLSKLDPGSTQTLMRGIPRDILVKALKGASESMRKFFLSNMSQRASKILEDDMAALGPMRLRDVDEAQQKMVAHAKELAAKGEIMISKNRQEDELVY